MTPGEVFYPGMEQLQGSHSVLGWNGSRESLHSRTEGLQGSHSVLGWNNSRGVILSWDRRTPVELFRPRMEQLQGKSFCPGTERFHRSHYNPGQKDSRVGHCVLRWINSRGVILSWDRTTKGESFCPGMERLQRSHSVLGWNDYRGVLLSWDGTTLWESFYPRTDGLQGSRSVLGWNDSRGVILS